MAPEKKAAGRPADDAKKPRADYGVDQKTFIWAWESSDSIEECHGKLAEHSAAMNHPAMSKPIMLARAADYRATGVTLKKYKPGRKPSNADVNDLNRYIAELRQAKEAGKTPPPPRSEEVVVPQALPPDNQEAVMDAARQLLADLLAGKKPKFPQKESR